MKKNILISLLVFVLLSLVAFSVNKITTVANDITLEEVQDCKTSYWNETENVFGECIQYYNHTVCSDEPNDLLPDLKVGVSA
ncbi:hypothetical protein GOV09_06925 [Candidatus Woesearchaeota archaeon]|nr:hypothetical protein [Candidatus Woesearchaeota archaeon]